MTRMTKLHPPQDPSVIVLLDVLGTSVDFHPQRRLEALAARTGRTSTDLQRAIWDSGFDARCDLGELQPAEVYAQLSDLLGVDLPLASLEAIWATAVGEPSALASIRALRAQHHVVLWSNNGPLMESAIRRSHVDLIDCCDGLICSWQLGARKESQAAQWHMRALLDAWQLPKDARLIAVDDDARVISAMRDLGHTAILCPDAECLDGILQAFFLVHT